MGPAGQASAPANARSRAPDRTLRRRTMPPRRPPRLTSRLLVVLTKQAVHEIAQQATSAQATDLADLSQAEGAAFTRLQLLLDRYHARMTRGVHSLSIPEILRLDANAAVGPFPPTRSLLSYWIVSLQSP